MNEIPETSAPVAVYRGESREIDPGACFHWLRRGWLMFMVNPGILIGCSTLLLVMLMAIGIVPIFGQIAAHLLLPLFGAGMIRICQRIDQGEQPEIPDLFAGFRHNAGQLVMVGLYFAIGIFGIAFIAFLLVSTGLLSGTIIARIGSMSFELSAGFIVGLIVILLSMPVIMATWYAPAMVLLHEMKPQDAMRASFLAGARNFVPMLIFATFLIVALFFAMLPAFLGLVLFVPVVSGAVYASYRDIFTGN